MKVLAVGCHPDDLEIACGGTLARYVQQGAEVTMCHVANGRDGHVQIPPEELIGIRAAETERAGALLGAKQVIHLGVDDMRVTRFDNEALDALTEVIRSVQPDVILTHNEKDYMQDHVETSLLTFNASFACTLVHRAAEKAGNSPAFPAYIPVFYMDTLAGVDFCPTHYVDITATIDTKLQALACHESQIKWLLDHDKIDFLDMVKTCSRYRGYQCGVQYAEGFRPCRVYPRMSTKHLLP